MAVYGSMLGLASSDTTGNSFMEKSASENGDCEGKAVTADPDSAVVRRRVFSVSTPSHVGFSSTMYCKIVQ